MESNQPNISLPQVSNAPPVKENLFNRFNNLPKRTRIFILTLLFIIVSASLFLSAHNIKPTSSPKVSDKPKSNLAAEDFVKLTLPERELPVFTLASKTVSRFGILPQETFTLKTIREVSEEFVKEHLQSTFPLTVKQNSIQEFILILQNSLDSDQLLQIKLAVKDQQFDNHTFDRNYSWAFQTQGKFRVTSNIPEDKKTGVPINTGIEITFSQDDYKDPQKYISIDPPIDYRLERHAETLAIVPQKPLDEITVYTVTLKRDLNLEVRDDPLEEDFSFSFQTGKIQQAPSYLSIDDNFIQVDKSEKPGVKVFTSNWKGEAVKTKIYQFESSQDFLASRTEIDKYYTSWYQYYPENEIIDTSNLTLVTEVDLKVETKENLDYLIFPDTLPSGYYFTQFTYGTNKQIEQLWLQVSNLAGFISVGRKSTAVWVNRINSNQAEEAASVKIVGTNYSFSTDKEGVVVFDTPNQILQRSLHYLEIISSEDELLLPIKNDYIQQKLRKEDYWAYLYHERYLYKPNDTIYFWGIAKERDSGAIPSSLTVELNKSGYYENDYKPEIIASSIINPDSDGTYFGSIDLKDVPSDWYNLSVKTGDIEIANSGISVTDYIKPEMKIDIQAQTQAIFSSDIVTFKAYVSFYDNTPASKLKLKVSESEGGKSMEIETDKNGVLSYSYTPKHRDGLSNSYQCITILPAFASEAKIEGHACVRVFYNKLTITDKSDQSGNTASIKASVNYVDLDKYNKNPKDGYIGIPAKGQEIKLFITKSWWVRTEEGTYYDYIEKVTRPRYNYQQKKETVEDKIIKTSDQGEISENILLEQEKSYHALLTVTDSNNHSISDEQYFYAYNSQQSESTEPKLTLKKEENIFSLGESIDIEIQTSNKIYPDNETNRFLFILSNRGNQEVFVLDKPSFSFLFDQRFLPNSFASSVIFTGKSYRVANTSCVWGWSCYYYSDYGLPTINFIYKKEDSELKLSLIYDKDKYLPGDKAHVEVFVTDKNNDPVPNAPVNLILVDQALEALYAVIEPSVLSSLYSSVDSGLFYSYYSHKPILPDESKAEKGGGGGGDRDIFKDTAFFGQAQTNSDGKAIFDIKLPDNITTWLVYAQGVTSSLDAGQTKGELISTQDFFVNPSFIHKFLQKDKPLLVGSSYGNGLNEEDTVKFEANFIQNEQVINTSSKQATAFKSVDFSFPQLSLGTYKLSIAGTSGVKSDKITLPFSVIENRFAIEQQTKEIVSKGHSFAAPDLPGILPSKPYVLVISDEGKGKYYWKIIRYCTQDSNRIEKLLAKKQAINIANEWFDDSDSESCDINEKDLLKFQSSQGGLSQVWWGSANLETTAWALHVNSSYWNKENLTQYLENYDVASNNNLEKIQAFWGLTNLGEPRIAKLQLLAENAGTFYEKVYAAIALADSGEIEKARDIYYDILADFAYTKEPYIRIQEASSDKTTNNKLVKDTSLVLFLATLVDSTYNDGLYAYISEHEREAEDVVLDLAQMAQINKHLEKIPNEDTTITFNSSLTNKTQELVKGKNWRIKLKPEEFDNYKITVNQGKAEITYNYSIGTEGLNKLESSKLISITRSYKNITGKGESFNSGDIVEVNLDFDIDQINSPKGSYTITDILPAGFVYLNNPWDYGLKTNDRVTNTEGVITYYMYNSPEWFTYNDTNLVYFARVAGAGSFIAEPSLYQSELNPSIFTYAKEETVDITNNSEK